MRFVAYVFVCLWLLLPIGVLADEPSGLEPADAPAFTSPTTAPLIRLAAAVAGVSAIGWALAAWSKKRRQVGGDTDCRIEILASRNLGPRHQLSLLDVGGHRLLIGTGGDSITTLADLTADASFGEQLAQEMPHQAGEQNRSLVEMIGNFEGLDG